MAELPVAYREETRHPALAGAKVSEGLLDIGADGTLIRHQKRPREEIAEIGERFVRISRPVDGSGDAYENLLPTPPAVARFATLMRSVLAGATEAALAGQEARLETTTSGWTLTLTPAEGTDRTPILLSGCGPRLRAVTLRMDGSVERRILLDRAR